MKKNKNVAIIVAHPDDETLWTGGILLSNPEWKCFIVSLCRKNDIDRAPKFYKTLKKYNANGMMGDLDDGPEQKPIDVKEIENLILELLPPLTFDLIITHNIHGEYTRHLRHEEVGRAIINLWNNNNTLTKQLWCFAYEDGNRNYFPKPLINADFSFVLPNEIWQQKYEIITQVYGFRKDSWEAKVTPIEEAFLQFNSPEIAIEFINNSN